jgi:hypothetical protein
MKKSLLLILFLAAASLGLQAGPRMKLLLQNVLLLKQGTLLVPPILADPGRMENLRAKGGDEAVAEYLREIAEANLNLRQYMESEFAFCKVQFLMDEPAVLSYSTRFQHLRSYPKDKYFVLQFGDAVQYSSGQFVKMKAYDTQFIGVFETDGTTRVYLNIGDVDKMHQDAHAQAVIENLELNLNRYHTLAEKKAKRGKIRRKKPQQVAPDAPIDPALATAIDSLTFQVQQVKLADPKDSLLFAAGRYRTVQTTREVVLYRYYGGPAAPIMGRDATTRRFDSPAEAKGMLAYGDGRNLLEQVAEIRVPVGTLLQVGKAAPYPAVQPVYPGGADRIVFVSGWRPEWLVGVDDLHTRAHYTSEEWFANNPRW